MNALLLYPEWPDTYWSFRHALPFQGKRSAYPPLGLLTIAALLPTHWAKRLVDTNVRALTDSDLAWADVAMVSGMLVQKDNLLVILARCRANGIRTVVGGPIASGFGDLQRYADHVVIGEAEELIAPLAEELERGIAKPQYKASEMPSLDRSPLPDLSLINTRHYSSMAIQYSRGCPFNCEKLTSYRTHIAVCSTACAAFSNTVLRLWPVLSWASIVTRTMCSTGRSSLFRRVPSRSQW